MGSQSPGVVLSFHSGVRLNERYGTCFKCNGKTVYEEKTSDMPHAEVFAMLAGVMKRLHSAFFPCVQHTWGHGKSC